MKSGSEAGWPATPAAASSATPRSLPPGAELAGLRVLVVDDDPDQLTLIAFFLAQAGATVIEATNAVDALPLAHAVDVLVSDLAMPDVDGSDLLRAIKQAHGGEAPLALGITGHPAPDRAVRAREAGFLALLLKPFESEELVLAVAGLRRPGR